MKEFAFFICFVSVLSIYSEAASISNDERMIKASVSTKGSKTTGAGEPISELKEYGGRQEVYQRGSCASKEVFVFDPETQLGKCETDLCYTYNEKAEIEEGQKNNEVTKQKRKLYVPFGEKRTCTLLGSSEECKNQDPNFVVTIDSKTHLPACGLTTYYGTVLNPPRCPGNGNMCDQPIQIFNRPHGSDKGDFDSQDPQGSTFYK